MEKQLKASQDREKAVYETAEKKYKDEMQGMRVTHSLSLSLLHPRTLAFVP
jgi:hypothetical protein